MPLTVAIVGRPNVGKSSLFNCLVERERVVTTQQRSEVIRVQDGHVAHGFEPVGAELADVRVRANDHAELCVEAANAADALFAVVVEAVLGRRGGCACARCGLFLDDDR